MSISQHLNKLIERFVGEEEAFMIAILIVVSLLFAAFLGPYLAPLFAAVVVSFVLSSPVDLLMRMGLSKKASVYLVYLVFIGLSIGLFVFLLPELWRQLMALIESLPLIVAKLKALTLEFQARYPNLLTQDQLDKLFSSNSGEVAKLTQGALAFSLTSLQGLATALIYTVLVPILVFFLMRDNDELSAAVSDFLPSKREKISAIWAEFLAQCGNYTRGKVVEIIIVGLVSFVTFSLLGLQYAVLLGLLVGLSVIVPFLGAAVVTIPVMLVGFFQWGGSASLLWLFIAYSIIQFLDGNVLVPLLFSEAVSIHPIGIIVAVLLFGGLWGIWGVFFAIPLATLIKALINSWPKAA